MNLLERDKENFRFYFDFILKKAVDFLDKAYRIHLNGIVQGVGFRPFVYRIAQELNIKGWVNNSSDGVEIHAEGQNIEAFLDKILEDKPPLAFIISVEKREAPKENFTDFKIVESRRADKNDVLISPDVATCRDCLREMRDKTNRRYGYPFINCTNCGPRYSIIYDRPYDRAKTTMKDFAMCESCREEYENPLNRRFHAQPIACEDCGPILKLLDAKGREVKDRGIGLSLLAAGAILAVKGLGGFHLVCNAYDHQAVGRLRKIKERGAKPFALMARNIETAAREVRISAEEKTILTSPSAPIVLLARTKLGETKISPAVAPGLHTLGMMLPYTPVHHLLFTGDFDFLVMTSANLSGQPLIFENEAALQGLQGIADYFLIHDRDIFHPCDDSVVQIIGKQATFLRRARGYVPLPVLLNEKLEVPIAGLGGEMKNAFCLALGKMAFLSQYIGDMHGFDNLERFKQEYQSYQKVVNIFPQKVACDLHPEYATTKMAKEMNCPAIAVQHHHAHLVSVMGEYGLKAPILGLVCDGTGYGEDGRIWGFEYLWGNAEGYKRQGQLEYLPLPGGDAGAKHPLRIAYAYLRKSLPAEEWNKLDAIWEKLSPQERVILDGQLKSGFQMFATSSAGRLFDAISGLLGICTEVTYEGQAAIELESAAALWLAEFQEESKGSAEPASINSAKSLIHRIQEKAFNRLAQTKDLVENTLNFRQEAEHRPQLVENYNQIAKESSSPELYPIWLDTKEGKCILKIDLLLSGIVRDYLALRSIGEIAYRFHYSLAISMLETALIIGMNNKEMVISGGVFQNKLLTEILLSLAQKIGIRVYYPTQLPSGDGGLALGQVLIANKGKQ